MKNIIFFILIFFCCSISNAQDNDIIKIAEEACLCIDKIEVAQENELKYEKIETCIASSITTAEIKKSIIALREKVEDSLSKIQDFSTVDSLNIPDTKNIIIDTSKNYKSIEEYLLRNCPSMEILMMDDSNAQENSVSTNNKSINFYNKGQDNYNNENYEAAIENYKKAVKEDKNFAFAWDMLGLSYRKTGDYKNAIKSYEKSLKIQPYGRVPLMNMPIAYQYLKKYDKAIEGYEEFSKVFPDDPEGYYGIARIYYEINDYENALDNMMKAYIIYNEISSPYARDAEQNLSAYYNDLKEAGNLELFNRMAEKHNIKIE